MISGGLTNSSFDPIQNSSPTLLTNSSTPTPTGSSSSTGAPGGGPSSLYAKVNKKVSNSQPNGAVIRSSKRESPDEGIQDDVSTDVWFLAAKFKIGYLLQKFWTCISDQKCELSCDLNPQMWSNLVMIFGRFGPRYYAVKMCNNEENRLLNWLLTLVN